MRSRLADLRIEDVDGIVTASIDGEIDSSNAADLRLALLEGLSNSTVGMVLDLSAATYVDSTGIALCFELARGLEARRQSMRLVVGADGPVRRVLELCAIETVAPVCEDSGTAVAALRSGAGS